MASALLCCAGCEGMTLSDGEAHCHVSLQETLRCVCRHVRERPCRVSAINSHPPHPTSAFICVHPRFRTTFPAVTDPCSRRCSAPTSLRHVTCARCWSIMAGVMAYDFTAIERKWQEYWLKNRTFAALDPDQARDMPKAYVLDMFPYPSGAGLHVGHPEGYTATDIVSRYLRMKGVNVLHPMGWDAFGLPAEQYAIKTGQHPRITTEQNIANFRRQIQMLGLSYDWDREVDTTDPSYYKWTQWIFLQLFNSYFDPIDQ